MNFFRLPSQPWLFGLEKNAVFIFDKLTIFFIYFLFDFITHDIIHEYLAKQIFFNLRSL